MKYSQKTLLLIFSFSILIALVGCSDDSIIPGDNSNVNDVVQQEIEKLQTVVSSSTTSAYLYGFILDESGNGLNEVEVSFGSVYTETNSSGMFIFNELNLNEDFAVVRAKKDGYLSGYRTFTPTAGALNKVSIALFEEGNATTIDASSGGEVVIDQNIQLSFPANSIVETNGNTYSGSVEIYGRYLDPAGEYFTLLMPGNMVGLNEGGDLGALISTGMLNVELRDPSGETLEIGRDMTVEVVVPAPQNAPETIPLWHFNEFFGLWVEAGSATKINNEYQFEVSHFSTWNLDVYVGSFQADFTINDENGKPLGDLTVQLCSEDNEPLMTVYTDDNGMFGLINAPQTLILKLIFPCDNTETITVDISSGMVDLTVSVPIDPNTLTHTISGQIQDCDEEGNLFTLNQKLVVLSGNNSADEIFFGGVTDPNGQYEITTVLCDLDPNTEYEITATTYLSDIVSKDTTCDLLFNGPSQIKNINFCGVETDTIDSGFVIPFLDANFEQAIRDTLNIPTADITYADVRDIDSLVLGFSNISSLSGIEYFTSLVTLDITNNNVFDISFLTNLEFLVNLYAGANNIFDISPLSEKTSFKQLYLQWNSLSDIAALENLNNLTHLSLGINSINDISVAADMLQLELLSIGNTQIDDVTPLCNLGANWDGRIVISNNPLLSTEEVNALRACLPNAEIQF